MLSTVASGLFGRSSDGKELGSVAGTVVDGRFLLPKRYFFSKRLTTNLCPISSRPNVIVGGSCEEVFRLSGPVDVDV